MKDSTDEILKRIQERIDKKSESASNYGDVTTDFPDIIGPRQGFHAGTADVQLTPDQITSDVFVIAPSQIPYVAEIFGNMMADGMNMRAFAPKIRRLAESALRDALAAAKKQGNKKK